MSETSSFDKLKVLATARKRALVRITNVMMRGAEALAKTRKPHDPSNISVHFGDSSVAMWWETSAVDQKGNTGGPRERWVKERPEVHCIILPEESPASVYEQALIFAQWGTEIIVRQVQEELEKNEAEDLVDKEIAAFEAIGACVEHDDCKDHPGLACACDRKVRSVEEPDPIVRREGNHVLTASGLRYERDNEDV